MDLHRANEHPRPDGLCTRMLQGLVIGFADGISPVPIHRGGGLGALFSLRLSIVPLFAGNYFCAAMLLLFGIIYGFLAEGIASRAMKPESAAFKTEQVYGVMSR